MSIEYFKKNIVTAVTDLFGEVGASVTIDILKYDSKTRRAILRVPANKYKKLHASLILCHIYEVNTWCCYKINKASPLLLSLSCDSRNYEH